MKIRLEKSGNICYTYIEQNRGKSKFEIFRFSEMLNKIVAEMGFKRDVVISVEWWKKLCITLKGLTVG